MIINGLLVLLLIAAAGGAYLLLDEEESAAAPATTEVTRGNVVSMVSATGNVVAARDVGVDFDAGGKLATVSVKVGERVEAGDVLARIENTDAIDQRDSAQATYDQAVAGLRQLTQGPTDADLAAGNASVRQAGASVDSAEQALADSRRVARTNRRVYDEQVRVARRDVSRAQDDRADARGALTSARTALQEAQQLEASACASSPDGTTGPATAVCSNAQSAVEANEQRITSAETSLSTAEASVDSAQDGLRTAEQNRSVGSAQQAQSVGSAESSLRSARASYSYTVASARQQTQPATDGEVESAQAQVASAEVTLRTAQRAVADTVLRAPAAGIVASISGSVGEYVGGSGSGGTTTGSTTTGTTTETSVDASGFVVLTGVDGLQVQADFSEADVSQLSLGRGASVNFEALDNAGVASGTNAEVTSIAPTSVVTDNVVTYEVFATLNAPPERLKVGQTATLDVVLAEAEDVLQVPSSAIETTGESSTVTVLVDGEEEQREVETGVVGDSTTEILSGLDEGDLVVASSGGGGLTGFPGGELPELPGGGGLG
ncbi:biotin/lipoyl-binding protein [Nocardioides sp. zg-1308]|uniref:biotin/lipoyl-binding protein n=1 Tax=Nocardioides sp. zg-1308 TaxID=2736253 RepID=UPI001553559B|nr:biotin/lipoyl-binding protein [Nocardioides sp. zg-1308]